MRAAISTLVLIVMTQAALAQAPGQQPGPAPQPQPYPQPYPQPQPQPYPQPYAQPGYAQRPVMQYQLTIDEQYLLERGYISDGAWIGGGLANVFLGFGIGQAIQGRWSEKGYIFTLGEGGSMAVMIWGMARLLDNCFESDVACDEGDGFGLMMAGVAGYTVFHIWSIIDALAAPPAHNRKLRALHMRLGVPVYAKVAPYVTTPKGDGGGAIGGLTFRF